MHSQRPLTIYSIGAAPPSTLRAAMPNAIKEQQWLPEARQEAFVSLVVATGSTSQRQCCIANLELNEYEGTTHAFGRPWLCVKIGTQNGNILVLSFDPRPCPFWT